MNPATLPGNITGCIFCDEGEGSPIKAGEIIANDATGYLIQAMVKTAQGLILEPDHWLLVPWAHVDTPNRMPALWDETETSLMRQIPGFGVDSYMWPPHVVYYLYGIEVGQTIRHRHGHVRVASGSSGIVLQLGKP